MGTITAFFRRNGMLLTIFGLLMLGIFACVQIRKTVFSNQGNYSAATHCTYYLEPSDTQKPLTREDTADMTCTDS
ncbi:MAG: hypothetical protein HC848_02255 [Limnobacter sp.]|nr:hypothetical protein [Limnobacter sp.]